jgi:TPR repeat protein
MIEQQFASTRSKGRCNRTASIALVAFFGVWSWATVVGAADEGISASLARALSRYEAGERAEAIKQLRDLADAGDAAAQYSLGVIHSRGDGVERNPAQAAEWYSRAAERGYARAQYNLGLLYANGDGVRRDYVKAYTWFSIAAAGLGSGEGRDAAWNRDLVARQMDPVEISEAQKNIAQLRQTLAR